MLQMLVVTLREGIEAFLIVAITVAYLRKTSRDTLVPAAWWGTGLATALSVVLGVFLAEVAVRPIWEAMLALVAAALVISMVVYMLIPVHTFWARFGIRIALLPLIAGVSYEIIRFAAKHRGSLFALMTTPGLWLQRITTQPPDDSQVECAIIALDEAMALEKQRGGELVIA